MHGAQFRVIHGGVIGIRLVVFSRLSLHLAAGAVSLEEEEREGGGNAVNRSNCKQDDIIVASYCFPPTPTGIPTPPYLIPLTIC